MRSRSVIPSRERCTKRAVSCASWPNAFTTRSAPSASCTTARAVLSSFFTRRDWRRIRGRYTRDRKNSGGQIVKATSASCRSSCAVTTHIVTTVMAADTNGIAPSTRMFWIAGASCWMR